LAGLKTISLWILYSFGRPMLPQRRSIVMPWGQGGTTRFHLSLRGVKRRSPAYGGTSPLARNDKSILVDPRCPQRGSIFYVAEPLHFVLSSVSKDGLAGPPEAGLRGLDEFLEKSANCISGRKWKIYIS
jgi:hypothetical protein